MSTHSETIHCLGYSYPFRNIDSNGTDTHETRRVYYAMNRLEIEQERIKAQKEGFAIAYWVAQTKRGEQIIKTKRVRDFGGVFDEELGVVVKVVSCPVCLQNGCPVCNYSGITKKNNWLKWRDWQIEEMKKEYQKEA